MTILFWPRRSPNEPLSTAAGILIGWKLDPNIVVVSRILHHNDKSLADRIIRESSNDQIRPSDIRVLATWDPTSRPTRTVWPECLPTIGPTKVGPWWLASDQSFDDESDMLVYFDHKSNYCIRRTDDRIYDGFDKILQCLMKANTSLDLEEVFDSSISENKRVKTMTAPSSILTLVEVIRQYSLFFGQIKFTNDKTLTSLLSLLPIFNKTQQKSVDRSQLLIDIAARVILGFLMMHFQSQFVSALELLYMSDHELRRGLYWLERNPMGFKVNAPLTHIIGIHINFALDVWHNFVLIFFFGTREKRILVSKAFAMSSVLLGSNGTLAALLDLIHISTWHISLIHVGLSKIYQSQLWMLNRLWKLFRGKKHNPLRQRTDSEQYDSMQLIVGILAFTFVLFLLSTVYVYHAFFALLYFIIQPTILFVIYGFYNDLLNWKSRTIIGIYLEALNTKGVWFLRTIPSSSNRLNRIISSYFIQENILLLCSLGKSLIQGEKIVSLQRSMINRLHPCLPSD
jgi:N-acetylglucosaminyl transferase component (Gpi1)